MGKSPSCAGPRLRQRAPAIEHRAILPATAQNFRIAFRVLRENRHRADYGPEARFSQDEVVNLIDWAEAAIQALFAINAAERRALVAVVLLRGR